MCPVIESSSGLDVLPPYGSRGLASTVVSGMHSCQTSDTENPFRIRRSCAYSRHLEVESFFPSRNSDLAVFCIYRAVASRKTF